MKGYFITFEGGEGAGKSTQISRLAHHLRQRGEIICLTREPGGSKGGEDIRHLLVEGDPGRWDPLTETLLHFASRRDHVVNIIKPALERGEWVLCDRFADSTFAYQGYGHGLSLNVIQTLYQLVLGDFKPDLTIILDIDVSIGLQRASMRNQKREQKISEDRYEKMNKQFHDKLRQGFLSLASKDEKRYRVIDANQSPEQIEKLIWTIVSNN
jgi:dTMP kinase